MGASVDDRAEESQPTISTEQLFGCLVERNALVPRDQIWLMIDRGDGICEYVRVLSIQIPESSA